jgi:hypothetical protein
MSFQQPHATAAPPAASLPPPPSGGKPAGLSSISGNCIFLKTSFCSRKIPYHVFTYKFPGRKYVADPSLQGGNPYGQSYGGSQYGQSSPYGGAPSPYAASPYGGAPAAGQQPSLYSPASFPAQSSVYTPAAPSPNVYNPTAAFDNSSPYSQLNGLSQNIHNFLIFIVR